jgi:ATP-binding cassette subfamily F protein uup
MDQHNVGILKPTSNFVQTKVEDFKLKVKTFSVDSKNVCLYHFDQPSWLIDFDEPTNHLDLEMIEWLEAYFAKENITLFMVTHDRFF